MKKEYTIAIHVSRLKKMLKRKDPCGLCPASKHFDGSQSPEEMWEGDWKGDEWLAKDSCAICQNFLGTIDCPCHVLDESEAIKLTYLAIEKYEDEREN